MVTSIRKVFNWIFLHNMMQINLLKNIVSSIVGNSAIGIVDLLYNKKNVNEFLIAKKLKMTINQTRNILYRLADEGLVSFIRKKDSKKGGWYIYFWTLNSGKSLIKSKDKLIKTIGTLEQQLSQRKHERFFYCKNCEMEFTEDIALTNNYTCPECGQVLDIKDTSSEVSQYEKEIAKFKALLMQVGEEVQVIGVKENKARERKRKAEEKKKSVERAAKKKANKENKAKQPIKKADKIKKNPKK